jgi:hypothetical protein
VLNVMYIVLSATPCESTVRVGVRISTSNILNENSGLVFALLSVSTIRLDFGTFGQDRNNQGIGSTRLGRCCIIDLVRLPLVAYRILPPALGCTQFV